MECPKCGCKLQLGHLNAGGYRILWTEKDRRFTSWANDGDLVIEKPSLTGKLNNMAWRCPRCRSVTVYY